MRHYIKYLFLIYLLITGLSAAYSQGVVTISGEAYLPNGRPANVTVLSALKNPIGDSFFTLASIPVKLNSTFTHQLIVKEAQFIVIHFLGHSNLLVYAVPGDSIHVSFEELQKAYAIKTLWATNYRSERTHLSGSDNPRMAFFEMLENKTGYLEGPPFSIPRDTSDFYTNYKNKVIQTYQQRLKILDVEASLHHFTNDFKTAVANELNGEFIADLMFPTFDSENLIGTPQGYFNEVNNYQPTWKEFKNSKANSMAAYLHIMYCNRPIRNQTNEQKLNTIFDNCMRFKDQDVKNYLLTLMLTRHAEEHPANFDELLKKYQIVCTNEAYKAGTVQFLQK